jgi:hypothetical protein
VDFEPVNTTDIYYFLVKNDSSYAKDVDEKGNANAFIDAYATCGGKSEKVQLLDDLDKARSVRRNIYSIYSRASTGFVLLIMIMMAILSTVYIPFSLKEYAIPAILRVTNDNMFFSTMRIRTLTYFIFMICGGCLPHLSFYAV